MNKAAWLNLVKIIGPLVIAAAKPSLAPLGGIIVEAISNAEELGGSSEDKKAHAKALSGNIVDAFHAVKGGTQPDATEVSNAVGDAIDLVVKVANIVHPKAA